jgi:hypothetical protein
MQDRRTCRLHTHDRLPAILTVDASRNLDVSRRPQPIRISLYVAWTHRDCSRGFSRPIAALAANAYRLVHSASTLGALPDGQAPSRPLLDERGEQRSRLVEAAVREQHLLDVSGPYLDLEEIAPAGDQRIVGFFAEEVVVAACSSRQPRPLGPYLTRPWVGKAVAHISGTLIFDVHVKFVDV